MIRGKITERIIKLYGNDDYHSLFFAPGRVNLIGEHIDYNGGSVLPFAINYGTYLAISENKLDYNRFYSENISKSGPVTIPNNYYSPIQIESWINYPLGIMKEFALKGHNLNNYDFYFYGNLPIASGLSSSASIEMVTAVALNHLLKTNYTQGELLNFAKSCENNFIGVNCGIMDQFAVGFAKADKLIKLDCKTLNYSYHQINLNNFDLVLINTNKPRRLIDSKYNERFAECQNILKVLNLNKKINRIQYICDLDINKTEEYFSRLKINRLCRRLKHVLSENKRVHDAVEAIANDDYKKLGKLLYESHESLRYDYEVTGIELDTIVDFLSLKEEVIGARMTGAGFGGCVIAMIDKKANKEQIMKELNTAYLSKIGYNLSYYNITPAEGARKI